ncbi:MAG: hypothetical protein IPK82_34765 [Polyangiaceae bacterium]|nr:hypothetical protein [Polyangiaceae bacterium]
MVLSEPAAHDPPDQAVGWLDEVALSLRLSRAAALVLIDNARPERLGDLVRTLRHDWPDIDVVASVDGLADVSPGSTIVLTPTRDDATWLNLRRGQFSERSLKVILFCDHETTLALKFQAPDFYDWIGRHKDCPTGPVPFAVFGVRAAFEAKWPVVWTGSKERAAIEETVRAAVPGEKVVWLKADLPFEELVRAIGAGNVTIVEVNTVRQLRRARWARAAAESDLPPKVVLVAGNLECPGYWPVHDRQMPLLEACEKLKAAGVKASGRVAALLDLEPEAIGLAEKFLKKGIAGAQLAGAVEEADAGAAVARLGVAYGEAESWENVFDVPSPARLRGLAGLAQIRGAFEQWQTRLPMRLSIGYGWHIPADVEPLWWVHGRAVLRGDTDEGRYLTERLRPWGAQKRSLEWLLKPSTLGKSALDARKRDEYRLHLASAVASLGEGDVAAFILRTVEVSELRVVVQPHLAAIEKETSASGILDVFLSIVRELQTAEELRVEKAHRRRAAGRKQALVFLAVCAAIPGCGIVVLFFLQPMIVPPAILLLAAAFIGFAMVCAVLALLDGRIHKVPQVEVHWAERPILDALKRRIQQEEELRERIPKTVERYAGDRSPQAAKELELIHTEAKAKLGSDHPITYAASFALADHFLTTSRREEALNTIRAQVVWDNAALPDEFVVFVARLLSETGRALDATRALVHLTATQLPAQANLRAEAGAPSEDDLFVKRLLSQPAGCLANNTEAHLTLVDALLKQGRYPEALLMAKNGLAKFEGRTEKAAAELRLRAADLTRRLGSG